jgi:glycerol-3-phosphate dehydrogenase (NAD(P)+)
LKKIAVIGGGSWGTALAIVLSRAARPHRISLWAHSADVVEILQTRRANEVYLPGFELPAGVEVSGSFQRALEGADIVLSVMPAAYVREMFRAMLPYLPSHSAFVSATKGLEPESHARMSEVIEGELTRDGHPQAGKARIAVLSGPSFAVEVARGDPTAVVLASHDEELAAEVQTEFAGPTFRLYTNDDVIGTEIAGAVKNVIAIAAGACAGLGLGANSAAALITRGLAEMTRLAVALRGRRDTISGLAGAGDLILTATGPLSRNRSVGIELGKGRRLAEILAETRMVAEGVRSAAATLQLARSVGVEMPIAEQVQAVLAGDRPARDAIRELMERRLKQE